MRTIGSAVARAICASLFVAVPAAFAGPHRPPASTTQRAVARGLAYLRRVQEPDGSWSRYPAITALAVAAFIRNGRRELADPAVEKGVAYIVRSVKPDGAIYSDSNPATALPTYNTCLCMMALQLTRNPAYTPIIRKAQQYLECEQFDEDNGVAPGDPAYGGIGYGEHPDRPDLSNLQMALEAFKETGLSESAPAWRRAIAFLQRVQNRRESNDQAWAKEGSDDGGFVYDSRGKSFSRVGGQHASYGSMTYAGLKSYIYCGVSRSDPRALAAWGWVRGHYTVSENPGMGNAALYYYYHTMAKTLNVFGERIVRDLRGGSHDWAHDLAARIVALQNPDGSWVNTNARFWENQPPLVTSYTLITLSYCK